MNSLQQDAILAYEDMVWRMAEAKDATGLVTPECGAICHAANKTIKQLASDIEGIRRRIALESEVKESLRALQDQKALDAKRQALEDKFNVIREKHEAALREIEKEGRSVNRRYKNTADARRHYRRTAPNWLTKRLSEIGERLISIQMELNRPAPREPSRAMLVGVVDNELSQAMNEGHQRSLERYDHELSRYESRRAALPAEREALEAERDHLERALLCLRPTPEVAGCKS